MSHILPNELFLELAVAMVSTINKLKQELRDVCLLHYDMDLSAVQQYYGGR